MNANTNLDMDALHAAIESDIKAAFPDFQTVEFYREDRKGMPLPAILLELPEWEEQSDADPGTEQLAVMARFEAEIIMGYRTPNVKRAIRKFAGALCAFLRLKRWTGVVTSPAVAISASRDDFNPELDKYEVWRVEWSQILHLGDTVWKNDGVVPSAPVFSWSPDIGIGHEADYQPVMGDQ